MKVGDKIRLLRPVYLRELLMAGNAEYWNLNMAYNHLIVDVGFVGKIESLQAGGFRVALDDKFGDRWLKTFQREDEGVLFEYMEEGI